MPEGLGQPVAKGAFAYEAWLTFSTVGAKSRACWKSLKSAQAQPLLDALKGFRCNGAVLGRDLRRLAFLQMGSEQELTELTEAR